VSNHPPRFKTRRRRRVAVDTSTWPVVSPGGVFAERGLSAAPRTNVPSPTCGPCWRQAFVRCVGRPEGCPGATRKKCGGSHRRSAFSLQPRWKKPPAWPPCDRAIRKVASRDGHGGVLPGADLADATRRRRSRGKSASNLNRGRARKRKVFNIAHVEVISKRRRLAPAAAVAAISAGPLSPARRPRAIGPPGWRGAARGWHSNGKASGPQRREMALPGVKDHARPLVEFQLTLLRLGVCMPLALFLSDAPPWRAHALSSSTAASFPHGVDHTAGTQAECLFLFQTVEMAAPDYGARAAPAQQPSLCSPG
jgi:hypothetical protein